MWVIASQVCNGCRGVLVAFGLSMRPPDREPTMSAPAAAPVLATEYTLPLLCCPLGDLNSSPVCQRSRWIYKMHTYVADIEGEIARLPKLRGSNMARRQAALGRWIDEAQVRIARVLDNIVELRLPATCSHPTYVGPELTLEQALPDCTCAL